MEEKELVSAIVITHDRLELVKKAIQSVQEQTYPNIELIVVDDASPESVRFELEQLSIEKGFKYVYIPPDESKGGNYARNIGILQSSGELLAFLDDDDEWLDEKIELQVFYIKRHPDWGMVHCGLFWRHEDGTEIKSNLNQLLEGNLQKKILTNFLCLTSTMLVRREVIEEAGLFDEKLSFWQDYELDIRLCQITKVGAVKEHLVLYRISQNDKNRLTNKLAGWETAVRYIESKHSTLIRSLDEEDLKKHKMLIIIDGYNRAKKTRNRKAMRKYMKYEFAVSPTIKNYIHYLLGCRRLLFWKELR